MEAALFVFTFILFAYNVTYTTRKNHRTVYTARNTDILSLNICQAFSRFILVGNACSLTDSHEKNVKTRFLYFDDDVSRIICKITCFVCRVCL